MGMRVKSRPKLPQSVDDGAHSTVVGGSTARLRRLCNASINEERKVPKEPSGYAADRGTALHHVVETAIAGNWSDARTLRDFAGTIYHAKDMAHEIELDERLLKNKALPALAFFDETVDKEAEFWLEKKMPFPGIPEGKGTADVVFDAYHIGGESGIIDWKFGDGVMVTADNNDQMRFYLLCAIAAGLLPDRDEYVAYIFQPAEKLKPEKYASRGVYSWKDLQRFEIELVQAIDDWRVGITSHNTGPHCDWCKGRIACKPYTQMLLSVVASDVSGLTTADLARFLGLRKGIEQWAKDVYVAALRNAQSGARIPGFRLEPAEGKSEYKDEQAALGALARLGVPTDIRMPKGVLSPAQALLWMKENGTPEANIARFKALHIRRPDRGEKLVEGESDGQDFGALLKAYKAKASAKK